MHLAAHHFLGPILLAAAGVAMAVGWRWRPPVLLFSSYSAAGRPFSFREAGCWVLAYGIVLACMPVFHLWTVVGRRVLRIQALLGATTAIVVPSVLFLAIRIPDEWYAQSAPVYPAGFSEFSVVSNVVVVSALLVLGCALCGGVGGLLVVSAVVALMMWMQAENYCLAWLPLTWTFTEGGAGIDTAPRWVWAGACAVVALIAAGRTRFVPPFRRFRL